VPSGRTRATDRERDACEDRLRAAYAAGCLDEEELEHRVGRAARAVTRHDLAVLVRDLPAVGPPRWASVATTVDRALLAVHVAVFLVTAAVLLTLWAVLGQGLLWPLIVLAPWAPLVLLHLAGSRSVRRTLERRAGDPRRLGPGRDAGRAGLL
jgi:hypothetical protein